MAELIRKEDTLNQGREKLNEAIKDAETAKGKSESADVKATQALAKSESTQTQLDTIVIEGDSSVEAAQARVDEKGERHTTLKDRIDDGFTHTTSKISQLELLNGEVINPDMFTGTDYEKLQQAIDICIMQNGDNPIEMKRVYDITGNTLYIDKGDVRYPVYFKGGGVRKNDLGHMFTGKNEASDIYFENVLFVGIEGSGAVAFDTDTILRLHTNGCQFKNVDHVYRSTSRFAQSIRSINDTITGGTGFAIHLGLDAYDCTFDNITIEKRESGILIGHPKRVRIINSVIEGLRKTGIKITEDATSLTISDNYFEHNMENNIDLSSMVNAKGLSIKNNLLMTRAGIPSLIKWGTTVSQATTENNWCSSGGFVHDASQITSGYVVSRNDFSSAPDLGKGRIRYYDGRHTEILGDVNKSNFGVFNRISVKSSLTVNSGFWHTFPIEFNEPIRKDDIITISVVGSPRVIIANVGVDRSRVILRVKSEEETNKTVEFTVNVLKFPYSIVN